MANKEEKVFVKFKEHKPVKLPNGKLSKPPQKLSFGNGEFRRTFEAKDQPFAVTVEEAQVLKNSGLFEDAEESVVAAATSEDADTAEGPADEEKPAEAGTKKRKSTKPANAENAAN